MPIQGRYFTVNDYRYGYTIGQVGDVLNVVLYGGNGNELREIREKGREIINTYSSKDAKDKLMLLSY